MNGGLDVAPFFLLGGWGGGGVASDRVGTCHCLSGGIRDPALWLPMVVRKGYFFRILRPSREKLAILLPMALGSWLMIRLAGANG